jgi:hypothetical protein
MYFIPDPLSAIRQSYEKSERFKETRNKLEYEGKTRRPGLRG